MMNAFFPPWRGRCAYVAHSGILAVLFALLTCGADYPDVPKTGRLEVKDAIVRANRPNVSMTAGYLTIENGTENDDRLLSATISGAGIDGARVELHDMYHEGGVMRMNAVESMDVPALSRLRFASGNKHLMILGLEGVLSADEDVTLELHFEKAGVVQVTAKVQEE